MPATDVEFLDRVHDAFLAACDRAGRRDTHYDVAGQRITLALAGRALSSALTSAFAHLCTEAGPADLTIHAWDAASTGVAPPAPVWQPGDYYGNGAIRGFGDGRVRAAFDAPLGMLSLFDVETRRAWFWLRESSHVPITIVGTPLRIILQWWAADQHRLLVHAAAIGSAESGALIAGASGSGKSTTTITALLSGLKIAGDDFVLVESEPRPAAFGLYNSAKIDELTLTRRFPALRARVYDRDRRSHEKHVLFLHAHWPAQIARSLPLRALLLPMITGGVASRVVPVGAGEALRALVSGVLAFPGMRQPAVDRLARLARAMPAYRLELGTDQDGVARILHDVAAGRL